MKKEIRNFLYVLTSLFSISFVYAQDEYIEWMKEKLIPPFVSIFQPILGVDSVDEWLFVKILLFFVIFSIVYWVLNDTNVLGSNKGVTFIVTLSFSILSVRFMPEGTFLKTIFLPYGAFPAAIAVMGPLMLWFLAINRLNLGPLGRRTAWFTIGVFYIIFWYYRNTIMGDIGEMVNWIYIVGIGFIVLNFLFTKDIHSYFELGKYNKARRNMINERMVELMARIKEARYAGASQSIIDALEKQHKELTKQL